MRIFLFDFVIVVVVIVVVAVTVVSLEAKVCFTQSGESSRVLQIKGLAQTRDRMIKAEQQPEGSSQCWRRGHLFKLPEPYRRQKR